MRRAGVLHERERALEQRIVGQAYDDGVRIISLAARAIRFHVGFGEFREADAEVDIGAGVIGVPSPLLAPVAGKHDAAEVEAAAEARRCGETRRRVTIAAGPD